MDKVAVVCHDAGGAEIVSSWVKKNKNNYLFFLDGPAKKIFKQKLNVETENDLSETINNCDWLLCGTSWQDDLEKHALKISSQKNIRSVSYLDHWINYKERFIFDEQIILPHELWVGDHEAQKIALRTFKKYKNKIKFVENEYLKDIKKNIINLESSENKNVLYVCEPIAEHAKKQCNNELEWGYDEFMALKFFMKNIDFIDNTLSEITIRPHPSEEIGKYDWVKKLSSLPITINNETDILDDISNCAYVVGCESMAMVIGLIAKKTVYSSIPPGGRDCVLPHKNIMKLNAIVKG
tara:strand:+ start:4104 stop:4988 length:885 start_codon:yes stop_codon:yes gene_type:complete